MLNAPSDDQEILLRYKKTGEVELVGILYSRYMPLVFGVCLKYLKDRDEAKDAVMQVFERLVTLLRTHDVEQFKSWLFVTTRNHCLMQLRAKKGKITEELSIHFMENEGFQHPEEQVQLEEDLGKLEKCLEKLELIQKQCVNLFFKEEKCYKEITLVTGFDINKVKSAIQNGKRNLKICMEKHG